MTDVHLIRPHVNPNEDFDARHEASSGFFSTEREPEPKDWGICLGGDATSQIGGQMMVFNWFENVGALLKAIEEHLVYAFLPPQGYDLAAAQRRVSESVTAFALHQDVDRLAADLRAALGTHIRIDWVGAVSQLMTDDTEFARSVRADFLDLEDTAKAGAIPTAKEPEFRDFLSRWMSGV
ncbi:hypothetical protein [Shinella sp.]|uniref:hypothetical protein n=1 Tax=Shinella sp. TaxID=1870904 RepID=UPI003F6F0B9D